MHRPGYTWVSGYWDRSNYVPGYWMNAERRHGYSWARGHWDGDYWVTGYWRPMYRGGYVWTAGYYSGRIWVAGVWRAARHNQGHGHHGHSSYRR